MFNTFLRAVTTAAAFALAACAHDDTTAAADQAQDAGAAVTGLATASTISDANAYVMNAAISDLYEVQSSQLALERTQSAAVRSFAQQMITDHTATTNMLRPIATQAGITPPSALDTRRQEMLENLRAASADDFDDRYIDQQTAAHQEALTLHRTYAAQGDHSQLKSFAAQVAPRIEQHLGHVRGLDQSSADD